MRNSTLIERITNENIEQEINSPEFQLIRARKQVFEGVSLGLGSALIVFMTLAGTLKAEQLESLSNFFSALPFVDIHLSTELAESLRFPNAVTNSIAIVSFIYMWFVIQDTQNRRERLSVEELRASRSLSYAVHILLLLFLLLNAFFFIKPKPRVQITTIEFTPTAVRSKKAPPKDTKRISNKQSIDQGKRNPKKPPKSQIKPTGKAQPARRPSPKRPKPVKPVAPKPVAKAVPKALRPKATPKPNAAPQLNKPRPVSKPKPIAKNTTGMAIPITSLPKLKNYNSKQSGSGSRLISTSAIGPKSIGGGAKGNTQLVSTLGNLNKSNSMDRGPSSFSTYAGGGGNPGNAASPNNYANRAPSLAAREDVNMGPYVQKIERRIKNTWRPPRGSSSSKIQVKFVVHRDGSISDIQILRPSRKPDENDAAITALKRAAPFDRFPNGYANNTVDIEFTFNYDVFQTTRY